jgi:hypothetical protein
MPEKLFGVPQPESQPPRSSTIDGIDQTEDEMPEPETYNPTEFMHQIAIARLGENYSAEEYQAALDQAVLDYPEAAALMRPGPAEPLGAEQAERAWQSLRDRGIETPSPDQWRTAYERVQAATKPPAGPNPRPIPPIEPIGSPKTEEEL